MARKPEVRIKVTGMSPSKPIKVPSHTDPIDVADAIISELRTTTPIDTGRARAGWDVQQMGNGNIRVTNDVHYVQYLEDGHSRQAPRGFVKQALETGRSVIRENRE